MIRAPADPSISAVLPAFNEAANLEQALRDLALALRRHSTTHEMIVVDDGSRDGSAALLIQLRASYANLRVVTHEHNRGYGAAVRSGFEAARSGWVFLMDADNQFDPQDIGRLLSAAQEADIVAGYRLARRDPWPRRLSAWAFFTLVRILFGYLAKDVNCAFKLIRRDLLTRMALRSNGALINTELLAWARRGGARVVEVPVQHFPRRAGKQTGGSPRVVLRAFGELFRFRAGLARGGVEEKRAA